MSNKSKPKTKVNQKYLLLTLFFTGAAILAIEIVGARLLGPYFGVGLFVWSSLITVALTALSVGYWYGGSLADKKPTAKNLYFYIFLAGVFTFIIPLIGPLLLQSAMGLGIRLGALVCGVILFGGPLFFLGIVSPYAVKLYAHQIDEIGTRVGHLYAISTVGSCAGSLMTGFLLIPHLRVDHIFYLLSLGLFSLWGIRRLMDHGTKSMAVIIPIGLSLTFVFAPPEPFASTKTTQLIDVSNSLHGEIRVEDRGDKRYLLIDGAPNSAIDKRTGFSLAPYIYYLEILPYIKPDSTDALIVGLGGGSIAKRFTEGYGMTVDAVEIDPNVVRIAKSHFQYNSGKGNIFIQDARHYVQSSTKKYDFVVTDVFSGDLAPFHLFSVEALKETKAILKDGGIFAINFIGYIEGTDTRVADSLNLTLKEVFKDVRVYPRNPSSEVGNVIFLASDEELVLRKSIQTCEILQIRRLLNEMMEHETTLSFNSEAVVLRDNYNPIQTWSLLAAEEWRAQINDYFTADN